MAKRKRRRESRWITDPLTGIRYERGSLFDLMSRAEKELWKPLRKKNYRKRRHYGEATLAEMFSRLSPIEQLIVLVIFAGIMFYAFLWESFLQWWNKNWIYIATVFSLVITSIGAYFLIRWKKHKDFEREQIARGLIKFVDRQGNVKWGTPEEVKKWKEEDEKLKEKEEFFYKVVEVIKKFEPSRKYRNEFGYHTELQGYLKSQFPNSMVEFQTGSSRPDIVIGDIAIEVKGPTTHKELKTIADKIIRYSQHYKNLIIVLFEVNVSARYFQEWVEGIKKNFPFVEIVLK